MKNEAVVVSLNKKFKKFERGIKETVNLLLKLKNQKKSYLEIYLVDGKFMNKNVLAFPTPRFPFRPDVKGKNLGEIYLNPDYIRNEKFKIENKELNFDQKLRYLLSHGFLHLLGYDHKKKSDRIRMQKEEISLFSKNLCKI